MFKLWKVDEMDLVRNDEVLAPLLCLKKNNEARVAEE